MIREELSMLYSNILSIRTLRKVTYRHREKDWGWNWDSNQYWYRWWLTLLFYKNELKRGSTRWWLTHRVRAWMKSCISSHPLTSIISNWIRRNLILKRVFSKLLDIRNSFHSTNIWRRVTIKLQTISLKIWMSKKKE